MKNGARSLSIRADNRLFLAIFGLLLTFCAVCTPASANDRATVYSGGTIITMDGDVPKMVDAVAVRDGRFYAVGTEELVKAKTGDSAKVVDLKGRTMLPGFIDAHGHVSGFGQVADFAQLSPPPLGTVESIPALQAALAAYAEKSSLPPGVPMIGFGYDDSQLADKRHPTRTDLDAVSTERPILITHASGHLAVMNSAMLKLAKITPDSADPDGGIIRREADGKTPNGVLEENAFFNVMGMLTPASIEAAIRPIVRGEQLYAAFGVTTAQDGRVSPQAGPDWKPQRSRINCCSTRLFSLLAKNSGQTT